MADRKLFAAAKEVALVAVCAAVMFAQQVALAPIPNVELVSLLVILFTLTLKKRVVPIIYVFVLLEGLVFGFHLWWVCYLYVWSVLAVVTALFRRMTSPVGFAVISSLFGFAFGALCAIPYAITGGGIAAGVAYWTSGILFDLVHGAANFVICLVLFRPIKKVLERLI